MQDPVPAKEQQPSKLNTMPPLHKLFTIVNISGDVNVSNYVKMTEVHAAPKIAEAVNAILVATTAAILSLSFYLAADGIWRIFDLLGSIWKIKVMG